MFKVNSVKNNKGFTLLEVLVAMAILTIISVPLLRAFATSAFTNRKAKIEMICTTASENLSEDFRDVPVETLISDYNATKVSDFTDALSAIDENRYVVNADGTYTFEIRNSDAMKADLPDGYYAQVTLDPTYYPNANALNLSQIEPVSIKDSAIYTMADNLDEKAYKVFEERNATAKALDSTKEQHDANWFKDNVKRTITIIIDKVGEETVVDTSVTGSGTPSGSATKTIDLVKVSMTIEYEMSNYSKYFSASDDAYLQSVNAYLFDNTTSKKELNSVYLFFYPRYAAGCAATTTDPRDRIVIENTDEIETYVYLTEMDGASDATKKTEYHTFKKLDVTVKESPADITTDYKGALTLRTNMNSGAPYSDFDTNPAKGKLELSLTYQNSAGTKKATGDQAAKIVKAANTDGKALSSEDTPNRIYKMFVKIYNENDEECMTFDGTKLEF